MTTNSLTAALQETVDQFVRGGEPLTTPEVADELDVGRRSTYERLERLVERGYLRTKKVGASGRVWWCPAVGGAAEAVTEAQTAHGAGAPRSERSLTRKVLETAPASIFVLDQHGDVVLRNERFRKRIGPSSGNGQPNVADIPVYDSAGAPVPESEQPHNVVFSTGTAVSDWECQVELASGRRRWVTLSATPITGADGSVERVVVAVEDTTQQRTQTERLERQRDDLEQELDEIFQRIDDGVVGIDDNARITYLNDRAASLFGSLDGAYVGCSLTEVVPELEATVFEAKLTETLQTQESTTFEASLDSQEQWLELTIYPSETGASVYVRDATERKARERTLERYRAIVETMNDGVYTVDSDGEFTLANDEYADQMGVEAEALIGKSVTDLVDSDLAARANALEQKLVNGEREVAKLQATLDTGSGGPQTMEATFAIMWLDDETYERVAVVRDITDHSDRKRALEQSNRRLETLVDNFPNGAVALVDEELRYVTVGGTPLEAAGPSTDELRGKRIVDTLPTAVTDVLVPRYEAALDGQTQSFEHEHDGQVRQFHIVPVRDSDSDISGAIGMSQDVTERKRHQRRLERRIRQLETITELGTVALQDRDLDALMIDTVEQVASVLDIDYCKVLDLDEPSDELLLRQGVGWDAGLVGSATVSAVEDNSQAAYTLEVDQPVVVEDLDTEPRFSGPALLTDHAVRSGVSVIIGPPDQPWGILGAHDTERREFSDHDINFVQSVANILATAIERARTERALIGQRQQLATLNNLNSIVHDITDEVIDRPTRIEIEQTVCTHLVETGSYSGAWIGDSSNSTASDTVRASAGSAPSVTGAAGDGRTNGDPSACEETPEPGSSLSIAIVHDEIHYGVLHVHADRTSAFQRDETAAISRLGEVVGHAIAASERKQALMSDSVVEVHYRIDDVLSRFDIEDAGGQIAFDQTIPVDDSEFFVYGRASEAAVQTVEALVEAVPHWVAVTFRDGEGESKFELRLSEPPVLSVVASIGATIESAVIEAGRYDMTVHTAPGTDVRELTRTVRDSYPDAQLVSRRQRPRTDETVGALKAVVESDLTEHQQRVLQAAYHGGYFDWPREASGQEIAERLGVSAPTFHQHLRKVEARVFDALLAGSPVST